MKYVVSAPIYKGETWGYDYPCLTTFETDSDEKAIRIFLHHKWKAVYWGSRTGIGKTSFLVSGGTSWVNSAILNRDHPFVKTALAGPDTPAKEDQTARTDEEEAEHQAYIATLRKQYGY